MANSEPRMRELPKSTVRLLGSSQVITTVYSVVKELLENALDAGSTSVDVRLENFGLDKIEVRDNGDGIQTADVPFVAKRYHTSKLSAFSDLEQLSTYGFRGEALGSLCTVADVSLTTKTKDDDVSMTYTIGKEGEIINSKPSHLTQGTTLSAVHLFKTLPVRRQIYNNVKKKKEELKKVETLVMAFGLIFPTIRITLRHNKDLVWQKNPVQDLRASITGVLGKNVLNQIEYKKLESLDPEIIVEMYVPRSDSDPQVTSRSTADRCFIYVNSRPVILKDIEKLLKQYYASSHSCDGARVPVCCVSVVLPSSEIDVNLDPNKTRVLLHHQVSVATVVRTLLEEVYGAIEPAISSTKQKSNVDEDSAELSTISDQSLELSLDMTFRTNDQQRDNFTKITALENTVNCDKQIPFFKVTMETSDGNKSDNLTVQDQVIPEGVKICSRGKSVSIDMDSNRIVREGDISELEVPHVPTNVITPPIASTKKQEQITLFHEEIVRTQKGCFDIVGDCLKDVLTDDDSLCEMMEDVPDSQTKGDNHDSQTKGDNPDLQTKAFLQETNSDLFDDSLTDMLITLEQKKDILMVNSDSKQTDDNSRSEVTPGSELWSKGQLLADSGSAVLQPVALLSAGNSKRPLNSSPDLSPPSKRRTIMPEEGQPTLYDMVSSQPVQRGQTKMGYSTFVKENRSLVVAKRPTATFDDVTNILKHQWEELSHDLRQKYENVSLEKSDLCSLREPVSSTKSGKHLGNKMKLKSKVVPTGISIKDQLLLAAERRKSKRDTVISFSMENLRKKFSRQLNISQVPKSPKLNLIGHLKSCGTWTCCLGEKICVLNCHRVQETVLYHQLMSDHVLSVTPLDQPIKLTPQNVGGKSEWDYLMSLDTNRFPGDIYSFITDERIVDNGFKVRCYTDKENGTSQADVVALTAFIPVYGIPDLSEVLELTCTTGAESVSKSRPLKVLNYLQGEAVRMARKLPPLQDREEVLELLDQMTTIFPDGCKVCLHDRSFCHPIYDIDDLPQTQSDMTQEVLSS
ncbi:PMS1 protein homolog 1-like [Mizuhopecten yessoensis]|uniref:PMS1 protein-like 1 n=1 Tax=Mizuhopecten yessoensis TaxID=6573 RepID=A0A210PWP3_MIZYE|nr:PMS1 protein homolog 1-like [Mizuhopecten yessoensis]OWF40894.1 PMS1 protein-like 1 [Mizuhopecten yessoensis]